MNVIFYELWKINGSLVDAIEYYLYLKSIKSNTKLVFIVSHFSIDISNVYQLIEDRYDLDFDFKKDIILESKKSELLKYSGNTMMIVDWGTFLRFPFFPNLWKNIIIWFEYKDGIFDKYKYIDRFENVTIFKEMHYEYGIDYKFKFAFDLFKKVKPSKGNAGYMNCCSKGSPNDVIEFLNTKQVDKLIVTTSHHLFDNIDGVEVYKSHPQDFFSLFNKYIHIHDGVYKDPRPRLFHESKFYNKEIIYINNHGIKDGGYYRYKDCIENDIQSRNLTKDDAIIQKFI